jgi:hypothetical protein
MTRIVSFLLALAAVGSTHTLAQDERRERVQFEPGTTGTTIEDSIQGYQSVLYSIGAKSGQTMKVVLESKNLATYFNVFEPGTKPGEGYALFIGSTEGPRFEGVLRLDGDYLVQVYMMRSAARRNETAKYRLEIRIDDSGSTSSAIRVEWPDVVDASGDVPCSAGKASLDQLCAFKVQRSNKGAKIWVARPGTDSLRVLRFKENSFSSDDGAELSWERDSDNWKLSAEGEEFYWIPDALIYGG